MNEGPELVVVHVAPSPTAAEVVRAKLAYYGIEAALQYESAGRVIGLIINGWGETRVVVPAELAAEARDILVGGGEGEGPAH